MKMEQF